VTEVTGKTIRIDDDHRGDRAGVDQLPERAQPRPIHRGSGDAFVDQHICLGDRVAFPFSEFLASFDLRGNRKPFALVFSRHPSIDGGIPLVQRAV